MGRTTRRHLPAVVLVAALALLLGACGDDSSDDAATTPTAAAAGSSTTGSEDGSSTSGDMYGQGATTAASVSVAANEELGDLLVGPDGRTLYLFEQDQGTTTACTGACADNWPPLVEADPTAGDGVDQDELGTAMGIEADQVTYHGHLLYYFAGDKAPGDVNGVGIPDWYAVSPDGEAIEAAAAG